MPIPHHRGRVPEEQRFSDQANSTGIPAESGRSVSRRSQLLVLGVLVAVRAGAGVPPAGGLGHHGGPGSLLTSSTPNAPTPPIPPAPPLSPTRIVHLPPQTIVNGTDALAVTLSAPPAPSSPRPPLHPRAPGTWSTSGNTELFTASSTLAPCSTYTLTVWADTIATGHSRVGRRHVLTLKVACPPLPGLQQILAR